MTNDIYYNSFGEQLAISKIDNIIDQSKKYEWVGYVFLPFIFLIKFILMSCVILTGFYFYEKYCKSSAKSGPIEVIS